MHQGKIYALYTANSQPAAYQQSSRQPSSTDYTDYNNDHNSPLCSIHIGLLWTFDSQDSGDVTKDWIIIPPFSRIRKQSLVKLKESLTLKQHRPVELSLMLEINIPHIV